MTDLTLRIQAAEVPWRQKSKRERPWQHEPG